MNNLDTVNEEAKEENPTPYRLVMLRGEDEHGEYLSPSVRHESFRGGEGLPVYNAEIEGLTFETAKALQGRVLDWLTVRRKGAPAGIAVELPADAELVKLIAGFKEELGVAA